jgi:hypothetical protein
VFSARAMFVSLGTRAKRQFIDGKAWRDGVPGMLRAAILVGFHFYIWAAFWQLSGARRTPEDDRFVQRVGRWLERGQRGYRAVTAPARIVGRLGDRARRMFGRA